MTKEPKTYRLSVLLTHQFALFNGVVKTGWVAECVEFDIGAQGDTMEKAFKGFLHNFVGQIMVDVAHGRKPLEGIGPSPDDVRQKFESAKQLTKTALIREDTVEMPNSMPAFLADQLNLKHELRVS